MSFVRVGRPQQHSKGKRSVRPRKTTTTTAARREWVSTVNDLSVHKLTPAELSHRHEIHKSHNKAAAQWELREKALRRRLRHPGSPAPLDPASLSIIREVFSDQLLLQDVLARSDRAMAVVKDLFGDAPRRQTGHPSVTMAPNCDSDSELPVLQRPDPPTQLSLLSQSMMDPQALNEVEVPEKDCSDEDTSPTGSSNHHVIKRANIRRMKAQSSSRVTQQHKVLHPNSDQAENDHFPVTPCTSGRAPDTAALNATVAVQRVRPRQSPPEEGRGEPSVLVSQVLNPEPPNQSGRISHRTQKSSKFVSHNSVLDGSSVASLSGDQSGLGLLQSMLGQVEADLDTLMPDTEPASAQSQKLHSKQGLTGFSVALVSTLGRLVHLHQQREEEAQREAQERRRLEQELREQRGLIDALTAETMTLREEFGAQQAGLQQRTEELEQKLDTLVLVMGGLGLLEDHIDLQYSDVNAAAPQSAHVAASPAVLLSPPRQRDNWQQIPAHPVLSHHGPPPVDFLPEDVKAHRLTSSLSSLPLTSLPSSSSLSLTSDPDGPQLSPQAILAEIAQLSRQNDMIKAQLSQARGLGSVERGSPQSSSSVNGLRRLSSSCSGRVTPESVGERMMSASSSTGRKSQAKGEQPADQVSSPNILSVNSVEQRLLELNRQSAAARGRLLELIEQQKQTVSVKVSPSHSPIPPSAFSPHSAGGSPELLSTQKPLPLAGDGERRSAGSVSPLSLEEDRRDGKTQIKKHKEKEGWFSLSAHVR